MKKNHDYFWLLKPAENFHKLLLTLKIVTIFLFCGIAFPAYSLNSKNLSGTDLPGTLADQQIKVSGTVTDASTRQLMPGVNIQIKGTTIGAISDGSGKYTFSAADPNSTLIFSFIGYVTQEVTIAGKTVIDVALTGDLTGLDEVVVVGYGTQKKVTVVGAITSISTKELKQSPTTNLSNALAGRLSGMIVTQYSGGEPGVDQSQIFVRGISTYNTANNAQRPIVMVDGIERDFQYLNPDEVESFSILKMPLQPQYMESEGPMGLF